MKKEMLNHYKGVHKMWNGKKWKLVYTVLCDGEKSHTMHRVIGNTYAIFRFDKDDKLRRFSLWENSCELEGNRYSYTQEEEEFCYDNFVESDGKIRFDWFDWSYPYLTEILRDENGVKIMEIQWQIIDDENLQN